MITGYTSSKLDVVKTYNRANPYQVGVNGVTAFDTNGIVPKLSYTIGDVSYQTFFNKSYLTTFNTNLSGLNQIDTIKHPVIKEEAKMGMVFPPKVSDELFIERMGVAVFERQSRLSEIRTLEGLINYRNGYYNITENI